LLPGSVKRGRYVLALALLDPAGNLPCARFAVVNYFRGGRHPFGTVAVGASENAPTDAPIAFDDIAADRSLRYAR
jgi:hypothetical protein